MGGELFVGFVLGVGSGLLTNYIWERRTRITLRLVEWARLRRLPPYDPQDDLLFGINRWSIARQLTPGQLVTTVSDVRPQQTLLDQKKLDREVAAQVEAGYDGANCYVIGAAIDHRESAATDQFRLTIAHSHYAEQMAVMNLLHRDPDTQAIAYRQLRDAPLEYLKAACPASIAANVIVQSGRGRLLAVRRSGAVDTAPGLWTLGIFETMILDEHRIKGAREDLFTLCERGLREEVGLEPGTTYARVVISWFGIYGPLLRGHVVAHARVLTHESEVLAVLEQSEGLYEADAYEWISPTKETVRSIMTAEPIDRTVQSPAFRALGRSWLTQTKLGLHEALRVRPVL